MLVLVREIHFDQTNQDSLLLSSFRSCSFLTGFIMLKSLVLLVTLDLLLMHRRIVGLVSVHRKGRLLGLLHVLHLSEGLGPLRLGLLEEGGQSEIRVFHMLEADTSEITDNVHILLSHLFLS